LVEHSAVPKHGLSDVLVSYGFLPEVELFLHCLLHLNETCLELLKVIISYVWLEHPYAMFCNEESCSGELGDDPVSRISHMVFKFFELIADQIIEVEFSLTTI